MRVSTKQMTHDTTYIIYRSVKVTFAKDDTAFADYPNEGDTAARVDSQVAKNNNTTRELLSDPKRYRVYYPKNSLGQLFTDIEAIMP